MKTKKLFFAVTAMAASIMISACGGSKHVATTPTTSVVTTPATSPTDNRAAQNQQAGKITLPFSSKEYKSNTEYFRAVASGKSPDIATAKVIAITNAKQIIAGLIRTTTMDVTDNYRKQRTVGDQQELGIDFDNVTRQVVNEVLTNINVMDEEVYRETDQKYVYWVVLEVPKNQVANGMSDRISVAAKNQLAFDKYQFQKVFDEEMRKFEQEQ